MNKVILFLTWALSVLVLPAGSIAVTEPHLASGTNVVVHKRTAENSYESLEDVELNKKPVKNYGEVSGTVTGGPAEQPLAGIKVSAFTSQSLTLYATVETATDGTYTISDVEPGDYCVQFAVPNGVYVGEVYNDIVGDDLSSAEVIEVKTKKGTTDINASLDVFSSTVGTVCVAL
ncbi:MAG: carboxypeptidase regulatory-like domain-containing protein [Kiritimatiellae bacterium]|jgi:hypothetical protein|nr:carboxypeptidase regulatory-like domain-containing protein [Kiritimatiellia bacterium]